MSYDPDDYYPKQKWLDEMCLSFSKSALQTRVEAELEFMNRRPYPELNEAVCRAREISEQHSPEFEAAYSSIKDSLESHGIGSQIHEIKDKLAESLGPLSSMGLRVADLYPENSFGIAKFNHPESSLLDWRHNVQDEIFRLTSSTSDISETIRSTLALSGVGEDIFASHLDTRVRGILGHEDLRLAWGIDIGTFAGISAASDIAFLTDSFAPEIGGAARNLIDSLKTRLDFPINRNALTESPNDGADEAQAQESENLDFSSVLNEAGLALPANDDLHLYEIPGNREKALNILNVEDDLDDQHDSYREDMGTAVTYFETNMRLHLDRALTASFGQNWLGQVDKNLRRKWEKSRVRSLENGNPERPILAYADLADLLELIVMDELWEKEFVHVFHDKGQIKMSFDRIRYPRNEISHCRPVTRFQFLDVRWEVVRIGNRLGFLK